MQEPQNALPVGAEYVIAKAELADVTALQTLADVCWRATYAGLYSTDFISSFLARAYSEVGLRHAVTHPASCFLVAKADAELVGFGEMGAAFHPGNGPALAEIDLYRLYLHPAHQRRGLGRRMMGELEAWLSVTGHDRYGCFVHRHNDPARAFYAAMGFVHHPERDTQDELYLVKSVKD